MCSHHMLNLTNFLSKYILKYCDTFHAVPCSENISYNDHKIISYSLTTVLDAHYF